MAGASLLSEKMVEMAGRKAFVPPYPTLTTQAVRSIAMATRVKRPIRIEGQVAYVPLTKGYEAIIDVADIPIVEGFNWCAQTDRALVYAMRSAPRATDGSQKTIYLHRVIYEAGSLEIDHKNGNGLDNRRSNLRAATRSENSRNIKKNAANTSGFKGVSWCDKKRMWKSAIYLHGKFHHLGCFKDKVLAGQAYRNAAHDKHGEFARVE